MKRKTCSIGFYGKMQASFWILILLFVSQVSAAWNEIPGVPEPSFGPNIAAPALPGNWTNEVSGFYFVDPSHPNSTDSSNTYGYPGKPRVSLPSSPAAGSAVVLNGTFNGNVSIRGSGTSSRPIYFIGQSSSNRPVFGLSVSINGSYIILDNIKTKPRDSSVPNGESGIYISEGSDHIVIRNSEMSGLGNSNRTGSLSIGSWGYTGSDKVTNVLIDNLTIHDIGDRYITTDQDGHGVTVHGNSEYVWVVNSSMTMNSGDGVQVEAQHTRGRENINHIYLGNNEIYNNKQTGLWVKHAQDVVISSNHIHDMVRSDSSSGACTGYQYSGDYLWFINNHLHDCYQGIASMSGDSGEQTSVYYIGNVIHDIRSDMPTNPHQSGAIMLRMSGLNNHVVNNTISNSDVGISAPISSGTLSIVNNIFMNTRNSNTYDLYLEAISGNTSIDNNMLADKLGLNISWNGHSYTTVASLASATGECTDCLDADPLFVNVASDDFRIYGSSLAKDAGAVDSVYSDFFNKYGYSLNKDYYLNPRVMGVSIDIGASEVTDSLIQAPPSPPLLQAE